MGLRGSGRLPDMAAVPVTTTFELWYLLGMARVPGLTLSRDGECMMRLECL